MTYAKGDYVHLVNTSREMFIIRLERSPRYGPVAVCRDLHTGGERTVPLDKLRPSKKVRES